MMDSGDDIDNLGRPTSDDELEGEESTANRKRKQGDDGRPKSSSHNVGRQKSLLALAVEMSAKRKTMAGRAK